MCRHHLGAYPWGGTRLRLKCSEVVVKKEKRVARGAYSRKKRKDLGGDGDMSLRQMAKEAVASASSMVALAARSFALAAFCAAWAASSSAAPADMAAA
jgi:hypothetical protein